MVIAGPGTGKTAVLTLRIANILRKTDIPPEAILALTFTESGAMAIKKRLAEIIGTPAYSVAIKTFHGFCNDIIKSHPEDFEMIIGSENIADAEKVLIVLDIIKQNPLKELKPFGDNEYYLKPIIKDISDLKREGISVKQFTDIVKKEFIQFDKIKDLRHKKGVYKGRVRGVYQKRLRMLKKNEELAVIYQKYQEMLIKMRRYDYDDMIIEV
ncbi:MAG: UvrD-helicase domain-containing protein, partial [bacterium]